MCDRHQSPSHVAELSGLCVWIVHTPGSELWDSILRHWKAFSLEQSVMIKLSSCTNFPCPARTLHVAGSTLDVLLLAGAVAATGGGQSTSSPKPSAAGPTSTASCCCRESIADVCLCPTGLTPAT